MSTRLLRFVRNVLLAAILLPLILGSTVDRIVESRTPEISKRINAFTVDMLKREATAGVAPANLVMSPQGIFCCVAMSYVASGGETRKQLAKALHFPAKNDELLKPLAELRKQILAAMKHPKTQVSIASSAWLDREYAWWRRSYEQTIRGAFGAALHTIRFADRSRASSAINTWVAKATHGRIKQVITPKDIASRSRPGLIVEPGLISVNAVYFKSEWDSRFDKAETRLRPFHLDARRTVEAMMMHQLSVLPYAEDEDFQFLELPYIAKGYRSGFSMCVLLPKQDLSVRKLVSLVTAKTLGRLRFEARPHEVDVLLPKFALKSRLSVKSTLESIGVKLAFDEGRADFDKMIVKRITAYRVYLSEIYHDAWIQTNEEGTEAAAATTSVHYSVGCSAAPPRPRRVDFHADHPFAFLIMHNKSHSVLFAGWISDPKGLGQ